METQRAREARVIEGVLQETGGHLDTLGYSRSKAAAILRGVNEPAIKAYDFSNNYRGEEFLLQVAQARRGDPEANAYIKGVLGTSDATGQAIAPNAFVAQ